VGRLEPGTQARVGVPLRLAVNPARLHFFDPRTGTRLPVRAEAADATPAAELAATP
jgi:hypothetical protein